MDVFGFPIWFYCTDWKKYITWNINLLMVAYNCACLVFSESSIRSTYTYTWVRVPVPRYFRQILYLYLYLVNKQVPVPVPRYRFLYLTPTLVHINIRIFAMSRKLYDKKVL